MKERMKHYHVMGLSLALIENGEVSVVDQYGLNETGTTNAVKTDSIFNACSISKFLTAMIVMVLTEKGVLDLDEDVNSKLKSWKVPDFELITSKKVTLRHLLSHQSGIIDPDDSISELNPREGIPSMVELLEGKTPYCKAPIKVTFEPESDFHYSDAGFCIIQILIEDVTGKSFEDVATEQIFNPLKMDNSFFAKTTELNETFSCGHNKAGHLVDGKYTVYPYPAASGLWTTPADLARLVIELMNSLKGESEIGLSQLKASEMIHSQGCKEWTGLGVFLDGAEKGIEISSLGWGVGYQCMMAAAPYMGSGLVIMTNTDSGVHQLEGIIGEVYRSFTS
ncbi:class A beta-lactamase-related serine hydrolase [Falsibacillus albus]|uniref:Class A beta-lactamase-related serine hydrolase n=2 Tax=Falsibacillus albus TaxID=2478915 RepID=A0A3L7JWH2_9BACI|nr:class A beta-lactamase-related serine hydrolase [Falsibacillus albus]